MFSVGDYVQPRKGIVAVQASNEQGEKYTLKAADVAPYTEEGDFGVC